MLRLHGFEVAVVCGTRDLDIYAPAIDGRTASGWIAGEVGQPFSIRIRQTDRATRSPRFIAVLYVEGERCTSLISHDSSYTMTIKGVNTTPTTFAPLEFAPLRVTETGDETGVQENKETGTLKITINRRIELSSKLNMKEKISGTLKASSTHERDKKRIIGGQSVVTGPERQVKRLLSVESAPYNLRDPSPYVEFIFKYRSRDYLLAADIIPRPPPSEHSVEPDDEEEDMKPLHSISIDEVEQTQSRIRQLKNELRNAEAALADGLSLPRSDVKREPFPFAVGVTVDLTGSDDENTPAQRKKKKVVSRGAVIDLTDD